MCCLSARSYKSNRVCSLGAIRVICPPPPGGRSRGEMRPCVMPLEKHYGCCKCEASRFLVPPFANSSRSLSCLSHKTPDPKKSAAHAITAREPGASEGVAGGGTRILTWHRPCSHHTIRAANARCLSRNACGHADRTSVSHCERPHAYPETRRRTDVHIPH